MAIYTIVDKDKDPLDPGEIHADDEIEVNEGDYFIIDASVESDITFEAEDDGPVNFDVVFEDTNTNDFKIKFEEDLAPTVTVKDDVDLSDVDIDAKEAAAINFDLGDNVSFGKYEGSTDGTNTIEIGDGFTTDEDWKLGDADDSVTVGNDATFKNLEAGDGSDTVTFGDRATIENFDTKEGDDNVTFGDALDAKDIKLRKGDDTIRFGKKAQANKVDGGDGNDIFYTETDGLTEEKIENRKVVCFVKGTLIETCSGMVSVEDLQIGKLVRTADNGFQPLRWVGSTKISAVALQEEERLRPIRISAHLLGSSWPVRDLYVSPQHRVLIRSPVALRIFGSAEMFIAAKKSLRL